MDKRIGPVILFLIVFAAGALLFPSVIKKGAAGTPAERKAVEKSERTDSEKAGTSGEAAATDDPEKTGASEEASTAEKESVKIVFQGTHIASSHDPSVRIEGNRVTITGEGEYVLKGSLDDGQVIVDAGPDDEVTLKLNNATIRCSDSSPLWIRKADKVKIRLKEDTENLLSDGVYYRQKNTAEKQPKACIDARCDMNIKGEKGTLTVEAHYTDGIYCSDDLKIKSGTVNISSERDALRGKDSVRIEDGDVTLQAGRDGIHTDGFMKAEAGKVHIDANRYGIYAFSDLTVKSACKVKIGSAMSEYGCKGNIQLEGQ